MTRNKVYKTLENFENIGPNWSKLGSFVGKHHILHVIDLAFSINWEKGHVTVIFIFAYDASF